MNGTLRDILASAIDSRLGLTSTGVPRVEEGLVGVTLTIPELAQARLDSNWLAYTHADDDISAYSSLTANVNARRIRVHDDTQDGGIRELPTPEFLVGAGEVGAGRLHVFTRERPWPRDLQ
ncbi:MAG: hypothetical protein HY904_14605 [Deltaproteobacteria bacterium]|nr:hypothetical protein [Deltaproteobacteria bacterium]